MKDNRKPNLRINIKENTLGNFNHLFINDEQETKKRLERIDFHIKRINRTIFTLEKERNSLYIEQGRLLFQKEKQRLRRLESEQNII